MLQRWLCSRQSACREWDGGRGAGREPASTIFCHQIGRPAVLPCRTHRDPEHRAMADTADVVRPSRGARLVASDGRTLPLEAAALVVDAGGGIARVTLEQRYRNPHSEPIRVFYRMPLPADGAVSGFAFRVGEQRVAGV